MVVNRWDEEIGDEQVQAEHAVGPDEGLVDVGGGEGGVDGAMSIEGVGVGFGRRVGEDGGERHWWKCADGMMRYQG